MFFRLMRVAYGTFQATVEHVFARHWSSTRLISRLKSHKLTYLSSKKLKSLAETCGSLEREGLEGVFIEAGCALGGSSILIATLKSRSRKFYIHDVFGMIPPPSEDDPPDVHGRYQEISEGQSKGIGGDKYYGYEEDLLSVVRSNLDRFSIDPDKNSIFFVKGLVQDTLLGNEPVALAHVDVDWYDPVKTCIERLFPRLVHGGSIIFDDYHDWGGCRRAVDEYLERVVGQYIVDDSAGSLKLTKL